MDASRLREIVDLLIESEEQGNLQGLIGALANQLANLAGNPQQQQVQIAVADTLKQLEIGLANLRLRFDPAQHEYLDQIGARRFFIDDIYRNISEMIKANPLTPAIVSQNVNELNAQRAEYLNSIRELRNRLEALGIRASKPEPGTAEVGFKIPRELFEGNLEGLIAELREIRFIFRAFSEVATGSSEVIMLKNISTTDPLFVFIAHVATISMIAKSISWIINTWNTVENIRKVRAETAKLKIEREAAALEILDKSISETIAKAVSDRVSEMIPDATDGRPKELQNHLKLALESLFARIERGLTVEIRFVPPPAQTSIEQPIAQMEAFSTLAETAPHLVFPQSSGPTILPLPRPGQQI